MSDERTRALERQAAAGDPDAALRDLRERLRRGALTREAVEMLAWCGDEVAWLVLDLDDDHIGWPRGLAHWGPEVRARAAVAAAREALPVWERREGFDWSGPNLRSRRALEVVEVWLADTDQPRAPIEECITGGELAPPVFSVVWAVLHDDPNAANDAVERAAQLLGPAGERRVRAAMLRALRKWALG